MKGLCSHSYGFSSSHVQMWELDHKRSLSAEELMLSNCGAGEDSWESLDCKEIKLVNPKGNQPWIFIERVGAEAEAPKNWLIGKDPDAGKDWRQKEKWAAEDEMVGWHHSLNGHEFEQPPGDGEGWGSLACYSLWRHKELDTTEQLNNSDNILRDGADLWAETVDP